MTIASEMMDASARTLAAGARTVCLEREWERGKGREGHRSREGKRERKRRKQEEGHGRTREEREGQEMSLWLIWTRGGGGHEREEENERILHEVRSEIHRDSILLALPKSWPFDSGLSND